MNKLTAIFAICLVIATAVIGILVIKNDESLMEFSLTIIDDYDNEVKIPRKIEKIVSLSPSTTEILFAVGLEDEIVGVDDYSDYPKQAKNIPKIGSYLTPNLEVIISLEPDIVFISDMTSKDDVANIEEKGLTVVALAPKTIDEMIENIRLVGTIGNKVETANNLADSLEKRIEDVTLKTIVNTLNRPEVYIEYYPYWTYGPGSFGNDLIFLAGGENIAESTISAYVEINTEFLVASNPDIIILTIGPMCSTTIEDIIYRTGWDSVNAIKNNEIFTIDDDLISRPGPRMVDALEQLAEIIHPELFL